MTTYAVMGDDFAMEADVDELGLVTELRFIHANGEQYVAEPRSDTRPATWSAMRAYLEQHGAREIIEGRVGLTGP